MSSSDEWSDGWSSEDDDESCEQDAPVVPRTPELRLVTIKDRAMSFSGRWYLVKRTDGSWNVARYHSTTFVGVDRVPRITVTFDRSVLGKTVSERTAEGRHILELSTSEFLKVRQKVEEREKTDVAELVRWEEQV